jgi:PleD family two-component response regulator
MPSPHDVSESTAAQRMVVPTNCDEGSSGPRARQDDSGKNVEGPVILVVDDDAANLALAKALLEAEGFEVRTAVDAISTFEVLKTCDPALILMEHPAAGHGWMGFDPAIEEQRGDESYPGDRADGVRPFGR